MEEDVRLVVPTAFDSELIEQLAATDFQLQHPSRYFTFIEQHLPIIGSMASGGELLCAKEPATSSDAWMKVVQAALNRWLVNPSPQTLAIVVGDNMLNYAYVLQYNQFSKHVGDFFSVPQDTYVLLQEHKLCFQYTYEDELFLYQVE
ncbi:MAG: hypothetical protein EOO61_04445 [Hymenobacter sp.]|nr:MAG: hypothetical protein EOO61_04445 [Hymenobacter sp.]